MKTVQINARYIKACGVVMAKDDIRYYLQSVMVDVRERETRVIATDGHRIAILRTALNDADESQAPIEILIPAPVVKAVKAHNHHDAMLTYDETNPQAECKLSNLDGPDLSFIPVDGKFPDLDRLIPRTAPSMEHGHFNLQYLADFDKVIRTAFDNKTAKAEIWPDGKDSPGRVTCAWPEFFGVLMPMRGSKEYTAPAWIGENSPAVMKATG